MFRLDTEKEIKERIYKHLKNDLNKSEGSILNDIVSAMALEIINNQIMFKSAFDSSFIETARGELLDLRCKEHGVYRKQGNKAEGEVIFRGDNPDYILPKDTIIINNNTKLKYITLDDTKLNESCKVISESIGTMYNTSNPDFTLINDDNNIKSIDLSHDITGGEDVESDEDLRRRLYFVVSYPEGVGTVKDYERWALEVEGVKVAKALPCYYGNGTVRVIVGGDKGDILDSELIKRVQDYICPLDPDKYGQGKAPIGSKAIVTTFDKLFINIKITGLSVYNNADIDNIKDTISNNLDKYLLDVVDTIRYNEVISVIIDSEGVKDFTDMIINDSKDNIDITYNTKGVLEDVTYE